MSTVMVQRCRICQKVKPMDVFTECDNCFKMLISILVPGLTS